MAATAKKKAPAFIAGKHKRNTNVLIKALESGKFTHETGRLEGAEGGVLVGNCCLGVTCRLAGFGVAKTDSVGGVHFVFPNGSVDETSIGDMKWWRSMFGGIDTGVLITKNDNSETGYAPVIAHLKRINARRK